MKITINLASLRAALASEATSVDLQIDGDLVVSAVLPDPPAPGIGSLPATELLAWYEAGGVERVSGAVASWSDSSEHGLHLQQATPGRRPAVGEHALGQGVAVSGDGAGAYLSSLQSLEGAVTCFLVAALASPPVPRGGSATPPPAFAGGYQSFVATDSLAHPSRAFLVGQEYTDQWLVDPGLGLGGTVSRDGEVTTSVGPHQRRHVYEITRDEAPPPGHLRLLTYAPPGGSGLEGQLWARGAVYEIVFLSASASEASRALVRADLLARHTTAPLVICDGDSLVAGNGVDADEAWPALLWERYGRTVDVPNLGVPGQTASQIAAAGLAPYAALARQAERRVLVLAAGLNDLRAGTPPAQVWTTLQGHAQAAQAAGWSVALCTLAPSPDTESAHPGAIAALNALILSEWTGALVDLRTVTSLAADDIHYTASGHVAAADLVGAVADTLLA